MNAELPIKRLRFAYHPAADESACGAFVAACRGHRLPYVLSALEGAGIPLRRPGDIQIADPAVLAHAAFAMRTDPAGLEAVAFSATESHGGIRLGDLAMPRDAFDWRVRRIGPASLAERPYHRGSWLNLLLPYCPESLERLVDRCPACGPTLGPLGWRLTRGIANCEECRERVPASTESPRPDRLVDDYRMAAGLMSRSAEVVAAALPMLPEELSAVPRTTVVEIMIRTGIVSTLNRAASIKDLRGRTPATIAAVVSAGARMLRGWPGSMRSHVAECTASIENDLVAYDKIRRSIRWMAGTTTEGRALVAAAFPNIDGRTANVFASGSGHYSATETNLLLSSSSVQLARLRDVGALRFEALPSNRRLRARYDADDVDELRRLLDDCIALGAAATKIDVPTYAIDQIMTEGWIDLRSDPGVVALRGHQVSVASLTALIGSLTRAARRSPPPADYVSLAAALVARPGEKPWGPVVDALLAGAIPFHAGGDVISLRDARVDPIRVAAVGLRGCPSNDERVTHISIRDACELLATDYEATVAAIRSAGIPVERYGAGKGVARKALRALASTIAFAGEAAAFTGRGGVGLHHEFRRLGVPRIHGGWSRRALVKLGMVADIRASFATAEVACHSEKA